MKQTRKQYTIYLTPEQTEIIEDLSRKWDKSRSKTISQCLTDFFDILKTSGIDEYGNTNT